MSPDGRLAVSDSADNTLKVWDLETGRELRTLQGHSGFVIGVAVTLDGQRALSASYDNTLKLWDLGTGCQLRTLKAHSSGIRGVVMSPDERHAVSTSWDNTLMFWNLETGEVLATFTADAGLSCCAFASRKSLIAGDQAGRVHFLQLELH